MPPRRSPRVANQALPDNAPLPVPMEDTPAPVPRRRGRPPRQAAPVLAEPTPPPHPLTLDLRIYNAHPLAFVPADIYSVADVERENKIYVSRRTYEVLIAEDTPLLAVDIRNTETGATALATIEGAHYGEPNDVYISNILMERLGHPANVNLLLVRTEMRPITKVELRIMDNDYALEDPVEAIQDYLNNYYILEEGTTLTIFNRDLAVNIPVYVEKIHPEPRGRITDVEIELELLRVEVEEPQLPAPVEEHSAATQLQAAALPMIPDYYPEVYQEKEAPKVPTQDEKEKIRLARLARFG